jgi:hypothetical protein
VAIGTSLAGGAAAQPVTMQLQKDGDEAVEVEL